MTYQKKIFKYELKYTDFQLLELPKDHKILTVGLQKDVLMVWVLVTLDENAPFVSRRFFIHGTGHSVDDRATHYIDTVFLSDLLIFHIFTDH